ncbi:ABC transporter ATP-binding protein [Halobaculum magnesiiphilum]|uniref:ABC transporter ATP-binding protein n=1 Tax=Halobaculum magnesiiphilum TaxID=1017351 RepID=A0A8T8WIW6_9EURY|nr:ABC transporter ATP-binding protein [Halobaculum magnesiiphilum]QZP39736.1 ABC transporter ATP-binding protein [Halobaculum magnesiiphilum]
MLRTSGLTKRFGGLTAVDDVDFALGDDELCSLIGPNGAGKTTFFNLLTGVLEPTEGAVEFRTGNDGSVTTGSDEADAADGDAEDADGWRDITGDAPHEIASLGVHRSYQVTNVFPNSSVLENVRVAAQAAGGDGTNFWRNAGQLDRYIEEAYAILDRVDLADRAEEPASALSHGAKRQLEVGIALAGDPDVLLLDEPNAGVSSESVDRVVDLIEDVATDHAVLLVEHNMDIVMEVSDRVVVLNQGAVIADDEPAAVRDDPAVQKAYLGGYEPGSASNGASSDAGDDADTGTNGGEPA